MDQAPAIVINDPGGLVWAHEALGRKYAKDGTKLIVAYCASACLNLIALVPKENVCFRRSAWVGHHTAAQRTDGTEPAYSMRWQRGLDRAWVQGVRKMVDVLIGIGCYCVVNAVIMVVVFGPMIYFAPELPWHD